MNTLRFKTERAYLQALSSRRSDRAGLVQLALHLALLALSSLLCLRAAGSAWLAPALLMQGALLVFLFCPLHEASHRSAFRSRKLNDAVAWGAGLLLLIAPTWFRHYHMAHHRWTQNPTRDPELETPKPESLGAWLLHVSGLPLWRAQTVTLLRLSVGRGDFSYLPQRDRAKAEREARLMLAIYGAGALTAFGFQSWLALLIWIGPLLVGQPLLRLFLLAEHGGCPYTADMLANTRTTFTTAALRRLCWNMNFHAEHHAYPSVPFHALPELHGWLRDRLQVTARGYIAANRQILRQITGAPSQPARQQPQPPRAAP
ncbi:fatty acid desaturase [Algihabitans albus]|uniref:fatty acid desaturase n=1 Tax=Algihabitans albus TaxID=2164067 RepID=UPI0013C32779|nr:fatty acid desaturase [Algihabitans albus]